jgi:DNA-binding transcriptional MocR family regulator
MTFTVYIYFDQYVPTFKSMDKYDHVIYLSSFSKTIFPGLRLGWVAAPIDVVRQLTLAKQLADLHSNTPSQLAVAQYCRSGLLDDHLKSIRVEYALRCGAMLAALKDFAQQGLKWNRPSGGFYIWCALPEGISATQLLIRSVNNGVDSFRAMHFIPKVKAAGS